MEPLAGTGLVVKSTLYRKVLTGVGENPTGPVPPVEPVGPNGPMVPVGPVDPVSH